MQGIPGGPTKLMVKVSTVMSAYHLASPEVEAIKVTDRSDRRAMNATLKLLRRLVGITVDRC